MSFSLPVLDADDSESARSADVSRRRFLGASSAAIVSCLLAQACGGGDPTGPGDGVRPPPAGSLTFANGVVTLKVAMIPDLSANNGHLVVSATDADRRADIVVLNLGGGVFRAFTSICTHEGCTVTGYTNGRMRCPCHGSEFDQRGMPVNGPAPLPLREYPVTFDAPSQTLAITVR
jgi:nitrite reductase/ring-hydroxylating ferredoxin subunit